MSDAAASDEPAAATYRVEIRFDVTGDEAAVRRRAAAVARHLGGEVTAIFDEDWEELD